MAEKSKTRSALLLLLKASIGLGLLAFVLYKAGIRNVYTGILKADLRHLISATAFVLASYFLGIKRWQVLSRAIGIFVSFKRFTVLYFLGLFCNYFLPAGVGGDVVKAYYLGKFDEQYRKSYLSALLDRYVGLMALFAVASIMAFLQPDDDFSRGLRYLVWGGAILFVGGGIAVIFFTDLAAKMLEKREMHEWVKRLRDVTTLTRGFLGNRYAFSMTILLSIAAQAFAILAVEELSLGVGAKANLASMFVIVPLVFLFSVLPISPGGLGTREAAFVYLLVPIYELSGAAAAEAKSAATSVALLWLAINLITSLPGIAGYPLLGRMRAAELKESQFQ